MNELKAGDYIKCHSRMEMVRASTELGKEDIFTDFLYEKDGVQGFWLVVTQIGSVPEPTLEEVKEKMCDEYCRYTHGPEIEDMESVCSSCPLNLYQEGK